MPLEVHPMTEADFPDFVYIQNRAFRNGMASKLAPKPVTPEYIQNSIEKHIKCQRAEPDVHYMKAIDTNLGGRMIAGAKWRINEKEQTEEDFQRMLPIPGKDEEGNQAAQDFRNYLVDARKRWMGTKPFFFLHLLVTDPEHLRRGAGRMLVTWGIERADKAKLPSCLEATEEGKPLYAKLGFEPVHEQQFDLSKYGGEGFETNTVMLRAATK